MPHRNRLWGSGPGAEPFRSAAARGLGRRTLDTHNGVVGLWWAADYPNEKRAGVLNRSGAHPILELVGSFSEALLQTLQDPAYRPAIHGLSDGRAYTLLDSQSLMDIYKALEVAMGIFQLGPGIFGIGGFATNGLRALTCACRTRTRSTTPRSGTPTSYGWGKAGGQAPSTVSQCASMRTVT